MKEIMAIVRINMMNKTKKALADAGISSITARDALGRGKGLVDLTLLEGAEKGYEEAVAQLGQSQRLIPKRVFFVVVPDRLVQQDGEDHHGGEPHGQIRGRQDLCHAHGGFRPGAHRGIRRSGLGRSLTDPSGILVMQALHNLLRKRKCLSHQRRKNMAL